MWGIKMDFHVYRAKHLSEVVWGMDAEGNYSYDSGLSTFLYNPKSGLVIQYTGERGFCVKDMDLYFKQRIKGTQDMPFIGLVSIPDEEVSELVRIIKERDVQFEEAHRLNTEASKKGEGVRNIVWTELGTKLLELELV